MLNRKVITSPSWTTDSLPSSHSCPRSRAYLRQSDVEAEVHDVTLLHYVLLAFQTQLPALARLLLAAGRHKLVERNSLRPDEALLEVPGAAGKQRLCYIP